LFFLGFLDCGSDAHHFFELLFTFGSGLPTGLDSSRNTLEIDWVRNLDSFDLLLLYSIDTVILSINDRSLAELADFVLIISSFDFAISRVNKSQSVSNLPSVSGPDLPDASLRFIISTTCLFNSWFLFTMRRLNAKKLSTALI